MTENERLQLIGLHAVAQNLWRQIKACEDAAEAITGEEPHGHTSDFLGNAEGDVNELMRLIALTQPAPHKNQCIACGETLLAGDLVLSDTNGGIIHAKCCGPEREGYVNAEGCTLGPDDPFPEPFRWPPTGRG